MWALLLSVLVLFSIAKKPSDKKPKSKLDEDTGYDTLGGPHIFTRPSDNFLGEGNPDPKSDPLSIWYDSR